MPFPRRKIVRLAAMLVMVAAFHTPVTAQNPGGNSATAKLDHPLQQRLLRARQSRVIIRPSNGVSDDSMGTLVRQLGGSPGRKLHLINAHLAILPDAALAQLAASGLVQHVSDDRLIVGSMERTGATIGAPTVREQLSVDGTGVGVAVIDSGVSARHDDLGGTVRVDRFVDFVNGRDLPYDDFGHGTHVAGIVAGTGFDSNGGRSGIAPGARLTVLKVLDSSGNGRISDVIAALEYVVAHRDELNIRVVNLSVATGVYESYDTDPLTLAAQAAVQAGVVVVAAAGNNGRSADGRTQYGGVSAPGNAPWVLTVGASSHMGTVDRSDDTMAPFSSRGPSAIDNNAKPDLVAPGVGIESLSDPDSAMYTSRAPYLLNGAVATSYLPYLSLSGTSMATPVVSGTVALMLQANPTLTPNAVKAILQYTSQIYQGWDPLTEGAGFLDAKGAVELSKSLADASFTPSSSDTWSRRIIWNNRLYAGGTLTSDATAWPADVIWGSAFTTSGQDVAWGTICSGGACDDPNAWNRWTPAADAPNVVWGTTCGGSDCTGTWQVTAVADGDTVVWGTSESDTVVWGTSCTDSSCEPVVWGNP